MPGSTYEIGVVNRPDGKGMTLIYDHYGPGAEISRRLGHNCEKLVQRFNTNVTAKAFRKRGHKVVERVTTDGTIRLECL